MMFEEKKDTHLVLKLEHLSFYNECDEETFWDILERAYPKDKLKHSYLIVNKDEPYVDEVFKAIKKGETEKQYSCSKCSGNLRSTEFCEVIDIMPPVYYDRYECISCGNGESIRRCD